jgi:hypothetical protein
MAMGKFQTLNNKKTRWQWEKPKTLNKTKQTKG